MKQGWEIRQMVDACDLITCGVAARPKYVENGIPFLSAKNVKNGKIIYEGYNCVSVETHNELTKKNKPLIGDILYTRVGSYGEAAVIEDAIEFSVFVSLTLIKVKKDLLNSYYLKYYLNSNEVKILAKKSINSSGVGNLNVGTVRKFPIPIPPLNKQKQIVAKLDKCFEAIDKARANVEKNLNNAKGLFLSRKNDLFKKLEEDLSKVPLPSVCDEIFAGGDAPKDNYSKEKTETFNIPIIANAVKYNGLYGYTNKVRVSKPSVTIAARGSGTGHTEIRYEPFFPIVRLIVIIPNVEKVKLEFLKYSIQNFDIMRSGSAIPQLTVPMIKDYSLSLPSISDQNQIVSQLDELKSQTQSLESNYQQELNALDELKKSILQKAFNVEL